MQHVRGSHTLSPMPGWAARRGAAAAALLLLLVAAAAAQQLCSEEAQGDGLDRLFSRTGGASWARHAGWGARATPCASASGAALPSHCCWHGVTCCPVSNGSSGACTAGTVTALSLPSNRLVGTLPPDALAPLACSLTSLQLRANNLTGPLPLELSLMDNLSILGLGMNGARPAGRSMAERASTAMPFARAAVARGSDDAPGRGIGRVPWGRSVRGSTTHTGPPCGTLRDGWCGVMGADATTPLQAVRFPHWPPPPPHCLSPLAPRTPPDVCPVPFPYIHPRRRWMPQA